MNWFSTLESTTKLIITGIMALIVVGLAIGVFSLFGDRAKLKEIRQTDARIEKQNKRLNAEAKAQDNATAAYFAANQSQATALAKELSRENANFDADARAAYYRVLNDALRGAQP